MNTPRTRRSFLWTTIDQPGEFFRWEGPGVLIEERDGYDQVWHVTDERDDRVYVVLGSIRYH